MRIYGISITISQLLILLVTPLTTRLKLKRPKPLMTGSTMFKKFKKIVFLAENQENFENSRRTHRTHFLELFFRNEAPNCPLKLAVIFASHSTKSKCTPYKLSKTTGKFLIFICPKFSSPIFLRFKLGTLDWILNNQSVAPSIGDDVFIQKTPYLKTVPGVARNMVLRKPILCQQ